MGDSDFFRIVRRLCSARLIAGWELVNDIYARRGGNHVKGGGLQYYQ